MSSDDRADPVRWAAGICYDGTGLAGWQTQPQGEGRPAAIQDRIEAALGAVAGAPIATRCAGRTDAGVHAVGQVIHFETRAERPESAWVRGTRAFLPEAIGLRWARPVPAAFDARRSARARTYCYVVYEGREPSPLWRHRAGYSRRPLDDGRLRAASRPFVGRHDFSAFRSSQCQAKTPIRTIERLDWHRDGPFVLMRITADGFLHHMVRSLVGTLIYAGDGRQPVDWPRAVLASRDRSRAAPTFAASGLYLLSVRYDPHFGLPAADTGDVTMTTLSGLA